MAREHKYSIFLFFSFMPQPPGKYTATVVIVSHEPRPARPKLRKRKLALGWEELCSQEGLINPYCFFSLTVLPLLRLERGPKYESVW